MTATRMKGDGFYDAHSEVQLSIIEHTSALITEAVERIPPASDVFSIIDYGCAEGKNSVVSVRLALDAVRRRNPQQVVAIIHNDLPRNNFNRLFVNLSGTGVDWYDKGAGRAATVGRRTFVFASGTSFYGQVVPDASAHFGYSSSSIHWMSEAPPDSVRRHIMHWGGTAEEFESFRRAAARDWLSFLQARAREFVPGGRLVLTMGAGLDRECGDSASYTGEWFTAEIMVNLLNDLLQELVSERSISNDQYERFSYPLYGRSRKDLLAPFQDDDSPVRDAFAVEVAEIKAMPCPLYARYRADGDKQRYARDLTSEFRAFSEPLLLECLFNVSERRLAERRPVPELKVLDALWERMQLRIPADPDRHTFNPITAILVLARR